MWFLRALLAAVTTALVAASVAQAGGGDYVFDGGTPRERTEVRAALEASSFDWNLVPGRIVIHIAPDQASRALPGHIWLDSDLLASGRFAWAVVQDEYAHQVDFLLFDAERRQRLLRELGGRDWCYGVRGLAHGEYGCERFASTLVWSYWPARDNAYRPASPKDESAAMAPPRFRALVAELLGVRSLSSVAALRPAGAKDKPAAKAKKAQATP